MCIEEVFFNNIYLVAIFYIRYHSNIKKAIANRFGLYCNLQLLVVSISGEDKIDIRYHQRINIHCIAKYQAQQIMSLFLLWNLLLSTSVTAMTTSTTNAHQQQQQYHEKYTPTNIFIGGLGYVGLRLASSLHEVYPHAYISGTVRSVERRDGLLTSSSNIKQQCSVDSVHVLDIDNEYIGLDTNGLEYSSTPCLV